MEISQDLNQPQPEVHGEDQKLVWQKPRLIELVMRDTQTPAATGFEGTGAFPSTIVAGQS